MIESQNNSFGKLVRKFRKTRRSSQRDLAHDMGITQAYLSQIERDKNHLSDDKLNKLSRALLLNPIETYLLNLANAGYTQKFVGFVPLLPEHIAYELKEYPNIWSIGWTPLVTNRNGNSIKNQLIDGLVHESIVNYTLWLPQNKISEFDEFKDELIVSLRRIGSGRENWLWRNLECIVVPEDFPLSKSVIFSPQSKRRKGYNILGNEDKDYFVQMSDEDLDTRLKLLISIRDGLYQEDQRSYGYKWHFPIKK